VVAAAENVLLLLGGWALHVFSVLPLTMRSPVFEKAKLSYSTGRQAGVSDQSNQRRKVRLCN
jgi:hypothetical protein